MKSINHSLQITGRSLTWAVLSFSITLCACGDEQEDLTTHEAFLEASTLSLEEMDLEILDVELLGQTTTVCSLDRIENRGRAHHVRRAVERRIEREGRSDGVEANDGQERDRRVRRVRPMQRPTAQLV